MNNFLHVRSGPKFDFITKDYAASFEKHTIDTYMEQAEKETGFWAVIPSLNAGIAPNIKAKHKFASLLCLANDDPSFYKRETEGKMHNEEFEEYWCMANLEKIKSKDPFTIAEMNLHAMLDAKNVLDFHKMCHMFQVGDGPGTGQQALSNCPIQVVW